MFCFVFFLIETRSQNTEKLSVDQAATVLLNFLQQAREGGEQQLDQMLKSYFKTLNPPYGQFIYLT